MYLTQSLHRAVQAHPDRIATICGDRVRTYAESVDRIARLGGALIDAGIRAGDRIAYLGLNSDRYHEYLFGCAWIGAVVNPVNTRWSVNEITFSLNDSGSVVLFVDDAFVSMVPHLLADCPDLRAVVYSGDVEAPPGVIDYEEMLTASNAVPDSRTGGSSLFGLFYTGGTTGRPKGVMITHTNLVTSGTGALASGAVASHGGILLHAAPMFHMADIAMWATANLTGAMHVMIPSFTPAGVVDAIVSHSVTDALLVPTMIAMLVEYASGVDADLSSMAHFAIWRVANLVNPSGPSTFTVSVGSVRAAVRDDRALPDHNHPHAGRPR